MGKDKKAQRLRKGCLHERFDLDNLKIAYVRVAK